MVTHAGVAIALESSSAVPVAHGGLFIIVFLLVYSSPACEALPPDEVRGGNGVVLRSFATAGCGVGTDAATPCLSIVSWSRYHSLFSDRLCCGALLLSIPGDPVVLLVVIVHR